MAKTKQMTDVVKGQILALRQQKLTIMKISERVGFGKSSIADFLKNFKETGRISRKSGSGRPKKTTDAQDRLIKRLCIQNRFKSSADIRKDLIDASGVIIDASTVRRRLIGEGFVGRQPAKKPFLNKKMRQKRLQWAKNHRNWTVEDWKNVIFSDESKFNLFGSDGIQHVRRRSGERYKKECMLSTVRHSVSRMVWGCFAYDGIRELTLIDGRVNSEVYISILESHLVPAIEEQYSLRTEVIFQDDSAPCHRSYKVTEFMQKNGIQQLDWPGNSPDLNPIENLWAVVKKQVAEKKPKNKCDLDRIIMDTWYNGISTELLQKLVISMPRRINAVIKAKGGVTKY